MERVLREILEDKNRMAVHVFLYLQLLDLLTTLVGFRLGASEASPFIRVLMHFGPGWGVLLSKVAAVTLGAFAVAMRRMHLIHRINYWYAALVVWNLIVMLSVRTGV